MTSQTNLLSRFSSTLNDKSIKISYGHLENLSNDDINFLCLISTYVKLSITTNANIPKLLNNNKQITQKKVDDLTKKLTLDLSKTNYKNIFSLMANWFSELFRLRPSVPDILVQFKNIKDLTKAVADNSQGNVSPVLGTAPVTIPHSQTKPQDSSTSQPPMSFELTPADQNVISASASDNASRLEAERKQQLKANEWGRESLQSLQEQFEGLYNSLNSLNLLSIIEKHSKLLTNLSTQKSEDKLIKSQKKLESELNHLKPNYELQKMLGIEERKLRTVSESFKEEIQKSQLQLNQLDLSSVEHLKNQLAILAGTLKILDTENKSDLQKLDILEKEKDSILASVVNLVTGTDVETKIRELKSKIDETGSQIKQVNLDIRDIQPALKKAEELHEKINDKKSLKKANDEKLSKISASLNDCRELNANYDRKHKDLETCKKKLKDLQLHHEVTGAHNIISKEIESTMEQLNGQAEAAKKLIESLDSVIGIDYRYAKLSEETKGSIDDQRNQLVECDGKVVAFQKEVKFKIAHMASAEMLIEQLIGVSEKAEQSIATIKSLIKPDVREEDDIIQLFV